MTGPATTNRWREEGQAIAASLDEHGAAVIIAREPEHAGEVALGIGDVQARRRRVAVADLVGELPPLQSLVPDDVQHGLMDAFLYGVSLNRIAHPVDRAGNLFIMQSGAGPIDYPALLRDDRWRRLTNGFRETGALLLAVVPEGAPGVDAIAHALGAIVRVDGARIPGVAPVIASIGGPAAVQPDADEEPRLPLDGRARRSPPDAMDALRRRSGQAARAPEKAGIGVWVAIAVGIAVGIGAVLGWLNRDRFGFGPSASTVMTQPTQPTGPQMRLGEVVNPDDSAAAAAYVVVIANVTDTSIARQRIFASLRGLPAPTFSPDTPWYRVSVGAFPTAQAADTMLRDLRLRQVLESESGYLLRAPYSLRLATLRDAATARDSLAAWHARGVPAFLLRQSDSTIALYAGAFERPEQAAAALAAHRSIAPEAVVAYRIGRAF
jgi:hypothetical protein